jgi:hypothetical protein
VTSTEAARAVEREFAFLKRDHALAALRVRGIERVQLHADLTILARLAQALSRTREVALAARSVGRGRSFRSQHRPVIARPRYPWPR